MTSAERNTGSRPHTMRLAAEFAVARILLETTSIDEAPARILEAIRDSLACQYGMFWLVNETGALRCVAASPATADEPSAELAEHARQARAAIGVQDAFAVPILLDGSVYGVIELLGQSAEKASPLLETLTVIGDLVGAFVARQRASNDLALLFELSADMLCVAGADGYLKRVNPAWTEMLGYSREELLASPWSAFVHPDDLEPTIAVARKLFEGERVVYFENRYIHKDGTPRWLLWVAAPPLDGQQVVYAAARDITERKANEELRAQTANLELLDELLGALVDEGDLPEVFRRVSVVARTVIAHDASALIVRPPGARDARVYASADFPPGLPEITELPEEVLQQPNWEHDILNNLTVLSAPRYADLVKMGLRSLLRIPILLDGQFAGALVFFAKTIDGFAPRDIMPARRMAARIAISLARDREIAAARRADEATARAAQLEARVRALTDELDARTGYRRVVGESKQWRQVLTQATQVAATDTTVLLLGESGTGKEVVARFLHRGSSRNNGPFIALNCAALPEQLLEAELFGYERGAYTGATQSKPGQLEQAAGGTLFLDEVGEMSLSAQAKFLRVLQEREFQRLGGTRVLRADVRIVAATNRDLQRAIANGQFREDLYYRLNVFAIRLPPLRERRDDILPLSDAFLVEIGRGLGRTPGGISRDARQSLIDYAWPGNVRELRNILERAAILCDGGLITTEHLGLRPTSVASVTAPPLKPPAPVETAQWPTPSGDLRAMERTMIEQALHDARFNKSKAAKALGLTRHQLYIRMRKYGFD